MTDSGRIIIYTLMLVFIIRSDSFDGRSAEVWKQGGLDARSRERTEEIEAKVKCRIRLREGRRMSGWVKW